MHRELLCIRNYAVLSKLMSIGTAVGIDKPRGKERMWKCCVSAVVDVVRLHCWKFCLLLLRHQKPKQNLSTFLPTFCQKRCRKLLLATLPAACCCSIKGKKGKASSLDIVPLTILNSGTLQPRKWQLTGNDCSIPRRTQWQPRARTNGLLGPQLQPAGILHPSQPC